jgi:hypothetical protein
MFLNQPTGEEIAPASSSQVVTQPGSVSSFGLVQKLLARSENSTSNLTSRLKSPPQVDLTTAKKKGDPEQENRAKLNSLRMLWIDSRSKKKGKVTRVISESTIPLRIKEGFESCGAAEAKAPLNR